MLRYRTDVLLNIPLPVSVVPEAVVVVVDIPGVAARIVVVAVDHTEVVHSLAVQIEAVVDMADIVEHKPPEVPHHTGTPVPCL